MKKKFLFMSVLASLFMVGCSQDETATVDGGSNGETTTSYLSVNLMSPDVADKGTRAASGYQDGEQKENKVTNVRFYFFTANGAIAPVKVSANGSYVNYYDWTPGNSDQKDDKDSDDTESVLAATIVINTKDGDKLPQRIAAVLNPTGLEDKSMDLTMLKTVVNDYAATGLTSEGNFVMFNSVYGGANKTEVCAVPIESKHLQKKPEDAKKNPVTIYVERSVAKVKVTLGDAIGFDEQNRLALKDKNGEELKVGGEQVYLKLNGWSLTSETTEGRLVKAIDPTWASDWWNGSYAFAHRSFWAINSKDAENKYPVNYNNINTTFTTAKYTNENALDYDANSPIHRTKVILKGQLCKNDGSKFTIVRHLGAHFADTYSETPANNLPALKTNILSQLTTKGYKYYTETSNGSETTRTQIQTSDLQIVIAPQKEEENSKNNCYVYAQLTDEAAAKKWYTSSDKTDVTTISADDINDNLKNKNIIDWALVWKDGMTYYYYEIVHHGTGENATKGVVRNHIYDTKITKIAGLGTPVYNPEKIIYPEKPEENDHYIAAEIDILSWRIVSNEYALEW